MVHKQLVGEWVHLNLNIECSCHHQSVVTILKEPGRNVLYSKSSCYMNMTKIDDWSNNQNNSSIYDRERLNI